MAEHSGFSAAAKRLGRRRDPSTGKPYGEERARAIIATASRRASPEAKRRNPRLKRVPGA